MTERPILFSAPMVRAILTGTKTQTRRAVKLPHMNRLGQWEPTTFGGPTGGRTKAGETIPLQGGIWHTRAGDHLGCPYGQPGDRLWVRETWMDLQGTGIEHCNRDGKLQRYAYRADSPPGSYSDEARKDYGLKWRPSIHMPRAASRISLEITGVRVERLQDISGHDAAAEGVDGIAAWRTGEPVERFNMPRFTPVPVMRYAKLWESINGPGSWEANPWVWVVEFRDAPKDAG